MSYGTYVKWQAVPHYRLRHIYIEEGFVYFHKGKAKKLVC